MAITRAQVIRQRLQDLIIETLQEANVMHTCLHCKHWNEEQELCKLAVPPSRPPAPTIVFGCAAFQEEPEQVVRQPGQDDDIPF